MLLYWQRAGEVPHLVAVLVVLALVNLIKRTGVGAGFATPIGVLLGVLLGVSDYYLGDVGVYQAASKSLIMGMSALGVYDITIARTPASTPDAAAPAQWDTTARHDPPTS